MASRKSPSNKGTSIAVGLVKIYFPSTKYPLYRIAWKDPDTKKRKLTTAGNSLSEAQEFAKAKDASLSKRKGKLGKQTLSSCLDDYLTHPRMGLRGRAILTTNSFVQRGNRLKRALKLSNLSKLSCQDFDIDQIDLFRSVASTNRIEREVTIDLRALLVWGQRAGYFSKEQVLLLPRGAHPVQVREDGDRGRRKVSSEPGNRRVVTNDHAPTHKQVDALATATQKYDANGELAVQFAAGTGLRWGEQWALTVNDLNTKERTIVVDKQLVLHAPASATNPKNRLGLPKNGQIRTAVYPKITVSGYELGKAIQDRIREIKQNEMVSKNGQPPFNPLGILFPAPSGGYQWHTTWSNDTFRRSATDAKWPVKRIKDTAKRFDETSGKVVEVPRSRRMWTLTHHSLRHRWALDMLHTYQMDENEVCSLGGWASVMVLRSIYAKPSEETKKSAIKNARKLTERKPGTTTKTSTSTSRARKNSLK